MLSIISKLTIKNIIWIIVYFFRVSNFTSFPITKGEIAHKNKIKQYKSGFVNNL